MLTFSVLWMLLAVIVTVVANERRSARTCQNSADIQAHDSGRILVVLAAIYGLALLAGFVYISKFLVSSL